DFRFTNDMATPQTADDVRETRINNAFNQGDVTTRFVWHGDPATVAVTADSFVKSQGVPGRATLQSTTGHEDVQRHVTNLGVSLPSSGPWSIGLDGSLFGIVQQQSFAADDPAFPHTDVTDDSSTVGGQMVARGAIGTHHVPGVLLASSFERFVDTNEV